MAKKLKESTIKSYSLQSLVNHLENYMYKMYQDNPFRMNVVGNTVDVYTYSPNHTAYLFYGVLDKKELVEEILPKIYSN